MMKTARLQAVANIGGGILVAALVSGAVLAIFLLAPTEQTMGHTQRIVYIHVSVAWFGLVAFLIMAGAGLGYLVRRDLWWDHWSAAAAEVGWLCTSLTLLTGSLWARAAWQTWWTWDPRLTTAFVLWTIYSGCLVVRASLEDPHRRARVGAVLAILGVLDIPLVMMAARWFRGMHPVAPNMEPTMRLVLMFTVIAFSTLFASILATNLSLLSRRRGQLRLENLLALAQQQADLNAFAAPGPHQPTHPLLQRKG